MSPSQTQGVIRKSQASELLKTTYDFNPAPATVVLDKPDAFDGVKAITGLGNGDHILRQGVLEVSSGYGRWKEVARFEKGVAEAKLDGRPVVAVRLRSTINQPPFALLAVREIILEKEGKSTLKDLSPVERLRLPDVTSK